ncbi:MAG: efflux RND transporter periplasmic adaptor subunit [Deltaproteobacteria bacterium]|nr:efflux RND transporter periplasmic adaptor subunit [Deltaproteobacteria bacterium]MBW2070902.1 efflux RND transporter periplasmic adaptor subunit [Deltaproteobacteria bacterium]
MLTFTKKQILAMLAIVFLVAALAVLIKKRQSELAQMKPASTYPAVVKVAAVTSGELELWVPYLGEIVPVTENAIASKVSGFIEKIPVNEGDKVTSGTIIVQIDDREIQEKLRQISAQIQEARSNLLALQARIPGLESAAVTTRRTLQRNEKLFKSKTIAREALDASQEAYDMALSTLKATQQSIEAAKSSIITFEALRSQEKALLNYTAIRAPFNGIVSKKLLSMGDLAIPGKSILELVRPGDGVKVEVQVPLEDFAHVRVGTPATILFDNRSAAASVSAIYPATDPAGLGIVNIMLPHSPFHLPFHSKVNVKLLLAKVKGFIAPVSCLLHRGRKFLVVKVDCKSRAKLVSVEVCGQNDSHFCFHTTAVQAGDRLVSARESRLMHIFPGQQVAVVP